MTTTNLEQLPVQPSLRRDPRAEAVDYPGRWRALPVLLVATFMALFDLFVVNVAAPSIGAELHSGTAALELVVGGYSFTYAAGLVTGGRLGDLYGHRKLFVAGMTAFAFASLLCGIANSPAELVIARLIQGATASLMVPQVLAVIQATFPLEERAKALSWFGLTVGVGGVSGQVVGGLLLDWNVLGLGWRAIFLVNVPIGLIAAALAWRVLPLTRGKVAYKIDVLGAIGTSLTVGLALVPLVLGHSEHWPAWGWVLLALSVPAGYGTLRHQRHLATTGGHPLLDLSLFSHRAFASGLAVMVAFFAGFSGFILALTLALQTGLGLSPLHAGLTFAPLGVAFGVAALISKNLVGRYGSNVVTAGVLTTAVGLALLLAQLAERGTSFTAIDTLPAMLLVGVGNGFTITTLVGVVLSQVPPARGGVASGMLVTAQQFAGAVGVAGLGTLFFGVLGTTGTRVGFDHALEWTVAGDLALVLIALATSFLLPRRART
ncbi:MFS transporter [Acidothermaceae bacterium B102]|nr:MFS transporter [Acidothermaceae bacterium B102]